VRLRGEVLLTLFLAACKAKPAPPSEAAPVDASTPSTRGRVEELVLGSADFGCARYSTGEVWCAGGNSLGQLGRGTRSGRAAGDPAVPMEPPAPVEGLRDVVQIVAGSAHACALTKQGVVQCWGSGPHADSGAPVLVPKTVDAFARAKKLYSGLLDVCAILEDGAVACLAMTPPKGIANVMQLSVGQRHLCALTGERKVSCSGTLEGAVSSFDGATEIVSNDYDVCARVGARVTCRGLHFPKDEQVDALAELTQLTGDGATGFSGLTKDGTLVYWDAVRDADGGRKLVMRARNVRRFAATQASECWFADDQRIECHAALARAVIEAL